MNEPYCRTVRVRCSIDHAFRVFTSRIDLWWPQGHRRFDDSSLHIEAFAGGRFLERAASGDEATLGDMISVQPPHRLSFTWHPGAISEPTRVDVLFKEEGGETVVSVVHSEGDSALGDQWSAKVALFERGWEHVFAAYAQFVARTGEHVSGSK